MFLGGSSLFGVEVPPKEKLQKQEQIAPVHDKGGSVVFLFDPTARIRLVVVESGQSYSNPDDHLRDLEDCDHNGVEPLGAHLNGHQEIVAIHRCVNTVIHDDKKDPGRRRRHVGMIAIQENRDVVVPVQKNEGLFVHDNEKSVDELTEGDR